MFAIRVTFRDEDGDVRTGQLVNTFRLMVEGDDQIIEVDDDGTDVHVACFDGTTIAMHRVPVLAVIDMIEAVPA